MVLPGKLQKYSLSMQDLRALWLQNNLELTPGISQISPQHVAFVGRHKLVLLIQGSDSIKTTLVLLVFDFSTSILRLHSYLKLP